MTGHIDSSTQNVQGNGQLWQTIYKYLINSGSDLFQ